MCILIRKIIILNKLVYGKRVIIYFKMYNFFYKIIMYKTR